MNDKTDVLPKHEVPPEREVENIDPEERYRLYDHPDPADEDTTVVAQEILGQPPITDGMLHADANRPDTWLQYNKGLENKGYTPANNLTPDNIESLSREYVLEEDCGGLETQPLITPGDPPILYYTVHGVYHVVAVNAQTGEEYWRFKTGTDMVGGGLPWNRGVGIWQDKVYFASQEMDVIAINRFTGEKEWRSSIVTDDEEAGEQDPTRLYQTQAPLAYDGKILLGESSDRAEWTVVSALDAETGEVLWQQKTAPKDEWVAGTWTESSVAAWNGCAVDPESHTVLYHTGNADPASNGPVRPGPNRHSEGVIAVDPDTGKIKWGNQAMAHELWDWDVSTRPQVFTAEINGEERRVVTVDWKGGYTLTIDIETGQTVARSEPLGSVEDHHRHPPAYAENAKKVSPAADGTSQWPPDAYNPKTGLKYVTAENTSEDFYTNPDWEYDPDSTEFVSGGGWENRRIEEGPSPYVLAVDPLSGDIEWKYTFEDGPSEPEFPGGATVTGGDVIFAASSGGNLVALNLDGERIWVDDTGARISAAPVVWDDTRQGKQYVAIASDNRIIVYSH